MKWFKSKKDKRIEELEKEVKELRMSPYPTKIVLNTYGTKLLEQVLEVPLEYYELRSDITDEYIQNIIARDMADAIKGYIKIEYENDFLARRRLYRGSLRVCIERSREE